MPNSPRLLWLVRHGERADNVDREWRAKGALPRGQWDDPPLSARGLVQAAEVGQRLSRECAAQVDFLLCSPFSRCLQTAQQILAKMAENGTPLPKVLIEPGFAESLNACQSPPGFPRMDEIRQNYPNLPIDFSYQPNFKAEELPSDEATNFCCFRRVIGTLKRALETLEGNLLVVSHGSPISALHFAASGQLDYMGQCTVSHYRLSVSGTPFGDENCSALLPRLCKSIIIRAVGPSHGEEANGRRGRRRRRNTMPTGIRLGTEDGKESRKLALALARLVDAVELRAELALAVECLAAGDASHLSEKGDLHNVLHI